MPLNKLLHRLDQVGIRKANLQMSKTENHESENLADMLERVNAKIEKLIESTPMDSDQLTSKIEKPSCEGQWEVESDLQSRHSSESEPDPEEPSCTEIERKEIQSLYELSYEELLAECTALLRENVTLKIELAAVESQKTMNEMDTQTNDAPVHATQQSLLKQKELMSASPAPKVDLVLPIPSQTSRVSSSKAKCHKRSQSVDVGSLSALQVDPTPWAYADSQGASSPPESPELSTSACTLREAISSSVVRFMSTPRCFRVESVNVVHLTALEENVQCCKESMVGGWREFYTPKSMHSPAKQLSSTKPSRRGSKSDHVYRRYSA